MPDTLDPTTTLAPLRRFCELRSLPLPRVQFRKGEDLPEPARTLLVHDGDMTPRLEAFRKDTLFVKPLAVDRDAHRLSRLVVLQGENTGAVAEFGAIDIFLEPFSEAARTDICGLRIPLGTILAKHNIAHFSRPAAWFAARSDVLTADAFSLSHPQTLFGRRNTLVRNDGAVLAEIVEILPPV